MTDQPWETDEAQLSKRLIGKISSMADFWSNVSDDDPNIRRNELNQRDLPMIKGNNNRAINQKGHCYHVSQRYP